MGIPSEFLVRDHYECIMHNVRPSDVVRDSSTSLRFARNDILLIRLLGENILSIFMTVYAAEKSAAFFVLYDLGRNMV